MKYAIPALQQAETIHPSYNPVHGYLYGPSQDENKSDPSARIPELWTAGTSSSVPNQAIRTRNARPHDVQTDLKGIGRFLVWSAPRNFPPTRSPLLALHDLRTVPPSDFP